MGVMSRPLAMLLVLVIPPIAAPQDAPDQPEVLFNVQSVKDYEVLQFVHGFSSAAVEDKSRQRTEPGEGKLCLPDQVGPLASSLLANLNRRFGGDIIQTSDVESALLEALNRYYVCGRSTPPVITYISLTAVGLETITLLGSDGLFRCTYWNHTGGGDSLRDIDPARHRELIGQFGRLELEAYLTSGGPFALSENHQISVGRIEGGNLKTDKRYEVPKHETPAPVAKWLKEVRLCAGQPNN